MNSPASDKTPRKRRTAREVAEKFNVSTRTAQTWISEPREDYLARAEEKRLKAIHLSEQGFSIREIAQKTGISKSAVHRYISES